METINSIVPENTFPEPSPVFALAFVEYLVVNRPRFWDLLKFCSDNIISFDVSDSMAGMGGCETVEELLRKSEGFKKSVLQEYQRVKAANFAGTDFQHMLFDMYLQYKASVVLSTGQDWES